MFIHLLNNWGLAFCLPLHFLLPFSYHLPFCHPHFLLLVLVSNFSTTPSSHCQRLCLLSSHCEIAGFCLVPSPFFSLLIPYCCFHSPSPPTCQVPHPCLSNIFHFPLLLSQFHKRSSHCPLSLSLLFIHLAVTLPSPSSAISQALTSMTYPR